MKSLLTSALMALILSVAGVFSAEAQQTATGWTTHEDYQYFFDEGFHGDLVPTYLESSVVNGQLLFNGHFGHGPEDVQDWATHHGMNDIEFFEVNQSYLSQGFRLHFHDRLDAEGHLANNGIWYR